MIKVVEFDKAILNGWVYDGVEKALFKTPEEVVEVCAELAGRGKAYIGLDVDGKVVGVAGIFLLRPWGVGYSWAFIRSNAIDYGNGIIREIMRLEREIASSLGLYRITTEILKDCEQARMFAEVLGYKKEGTLRKHGPNKETMLIYSKLLKG